MVRTRAEAYEQTLAYIESGIRAALSAIPAAQKEHVQEIRLREGRQPSLFMGGREQILQCRKVTRADIDESFRLACEYSIHSYQREIAQGFLTVRGGHRIGLCGTAVVKCGVVESVKDISGMNIRVAREVFGSADEIMHRVLSGDGQGGILLAGAPSSGKTTILRDLCRQLGKTTKLSIIDERGEIAAVYRGIPQNAVGEQSDVFDGYPKAAGIMMALRVMSPQVIACDEIGDEADCKGIEACLHAGVRIIATAHASSIPELYARRHIASMLESGAFGKIVLLDNAQNAGKIKAIVEVGDSGNQAGGYRVGHAGEHANRCSSVV